jgi:hypothetical protein
MAETPVVAWGALAPSARPRRGHANDAEQFICGKFSVWAYPTSRMVVDVAGSILTGVTGLAGAALGWVALNFFGKPILALKEKRREALEIGERYSYVGLHYRLIGDDVLYATLKEGDDYVKQAVLSLRDAGNSLRAHFRERSLATRIYCLAFGYDLDYAARCLLGLAEAARTAGSLDVGEKARRLTLHALFVALGATQHLSAGEIAAARTEMKKWDYGNPDVTTSSRAEDRCSSPKAG